MPSIAAAVATIEANPAPMVYLDTCVLLDIIRAPLRNTAAAVQAASELMTGAQRKPPTVYLVIGCPTPTEWNDHVEEAIADCTTAVTSVNAVSEAWGFLGSAGIPLLPLWAMPLPDRLKDLSENLHNAAILLDKDGDALSRAIERVITGEPPAKKGGKGAKTPSTWNTPSVSRTRFGPMGFCSDAFLPAQIPTILPSRKRPHFIPFLHRFLLPQPASTTQPVSRRRSRCLKEGAGCP